MEPTSFSLTWAGYSLGWLKRRHLESSCSPPLLVWYSTFFLWFNITYIYIYIAGTCLKAISTERVWYEGGKALLLHRSENVFIWLSEWIHQLSNSKLKITFALLLWRVLSVKIHVYLSNLISICFSLLSELLFPPRKVLGSSLYLLYSEISRIWESLWVFSLHLLYGTLRGPS